MTFTLTDEQKAIVEFTTSSTDNLAVIARAGSGKTATLVLIAEALPEENIICLAFNKKIASEMTERLPENCEAKTLHAIGYRAWYNYLGKGCKLNDRKCYQLLKDLIDDLDKEEKQEAYKTLSETLEIIRTAKNEGYLPEKYKGHWKPLISDDDFYLSLPLEPSLLQRQLCDKVLISSFKELLRGELDFADMIYGPALCSVPMPNPTLTLIDEAQDLSPIDHVVIKKLVKNRRVIAVGDPCQAIYGFRGALADSMEQLIKKFSMEKLSLTMTFRCAIEVVKNAQWRAPDMRWTDSAKTGAVETLQTWSASDLQDDDAIICRNNAPLLSMAIKMIAVDLLPELSGVDIAAQLKKLMKSLGKSSLLKAGALAALEEWKQTQLKRARSGAEGKIKDQAECVRILLERTENLGDAIFYLETLMQRKGRIPLMTGHKSKGLEFDRVFFLDQHLCVIKKDQDANIKYVIETRAKTHLTYVTSEGFENV